MSSQQTVEGVESMNHAYVLVLSCLLLSSCAKVPIQEMSDARQALKAAYIAKANEYSPESLTKAEENLTLAEQNLASGYLEQARQDAVMSKQHAVQAYKMASAIERAQTIWQTISELIYSEYEVNRLIKKAQNAASDNNLNSVLHFANEAYQRGEEVLNKLRLKHAQQLIEQLDNMTLLPEEMTSLRTAKAAYDNQEGQQAYDLAKELLEQIGQRLTH